MFHKQLFVANMFWRFLGKKMTKKFLQETDERPKYAIFCLFVWLVTAWYTRDLILSTTSMCVIMLIFIAALFEHYQMTLSIFTVIETLFMYAWIGQKFLEYVREHACVHVTERSEMKNYWCQWRIDLYATCLILTEYFPIWFDLMGRMIT